MNSNAPKSFPPSRREASRRARRAAVALALSGALNFSSFKTRGEDRVDYRYEDYAEAGGRIHIRTHGVYFDTALKPWLSLKGNYIYDGISGATPTGAPPLPGQSTVAKVNIDDIRRAGFIEPTFKFGQHTLSPQIAYSKESDYESFGLSLNHSIDLKEKNTALTWGVSHAFDSILATPGTRLKAAQDKNSTDLMLGVTQLLGLATTLTANLTIGYSEGFLTDPYKRVLFDDFPYFPGQPYTVFPEQRPDHKFRQVALISLQHYFEKLRGAAETSYRLHHDDFGTVAHTVTLQWHQKLGKAVTVSPLFRFHTQTAADFYATHFAGDPSCPPGADPSCPPIPLPRFFSSDYRLSALDTFTYGLNVSVHLHEHISLDFGFKRYEMFGRDGVTSADQYPKANVFTGGLTIWF